MFTFTYENEAMWPSEVRCAHLSASYRAVSQTLSSWIDEMKAWETAIDNARTIYSEQADVAAAGESTQAWNWNFVWINVGRHPAAKLAEYMTPCVSSVSRQRCVRSITIWTLGFSPDECKLLTEATKNVTNKPVETLDLQTLNFRGRSRCANFVLNGQQTHVGQRSSVARMAVLEARQGAYSDITDVIIDDEFDAVLRNANAFFTLKNITFRQDFFQPDAPRDRVMRPFIDTNLCGLRNDRVGIATQYLNNVESLLQSRAADIDMPGRHIWRYYTGPNALHPAVKDVMSHPDVYILMQGGLDDMFDALKTQNVSVMQLKEWIKRQRSALDSGNPGNIATRRREFLSRGIGFIDNSTMLWA